jgi:hypothetical protein
MRNAITKRSTRLAANALIATLALALPTLIPLQGATIAVAHPLGTRAAARRIPCRPAAGTTTIAHSTKARIFSDPKTGDDYACLYSNGHARFLSSTEHWEYPLARFAGDFVAFVAFAEGVNREIGVMNMRTGHVRDFGEAEEVAPIKLAPSECPSAVPNCSAVCQQVESLVLKSDGALAWIAVNFPPRSSKPGVFCGNSFPPVTEVRRDDRHGLRVIGEGDGILPSSLRLTGSTLLWIDEGNTVAAALL